MGVPRTPSERLRLPLRTGDRRCPPRVRRVRRRRQPGRVDRRRAALLRGCAAGPRSCARHGSPSDPWARARPWQRFGAPGCEAGQHSARRHGGREDHRLRSRPVQGRLRDLDTGACLRTWTGPREPNLSACLSADGRLAMSTHQVMSSGAKDEPIRLWDAGAERASSRGTRAGSPPCGSHPTPGSPSRPATTDPYGCGKSPPADACTCSKGTNNISSTSNSPPTCATWSQRETTESGSGTSTGSWRPTERSGTRAVRRSRQNAHVHRLILPKPSPCPTHWSLVVGESWHRTRSLSNCPSTSTGSSPRTPHAWRRILRTRCAVTLLNRAIPSRAPWPLTCVRHPSARPSGSASAAKSFQPDRHGTPGTQAASREKHEAEMKQMDESERVPRTEEELPRPGHTATERREIMARARARDGEFIFYRSHSEPFSGLASSAVAPVRGVVEVAARMVRPRLGRYRVLRAVEEPTCW